MMLNSLLFSPISSGSVAEQLGVRFTVMAIAAFAASANRSSRDRFASIRANIAPHTAGFISDRTVTIARSCSFINQAGGPFGPPARS